MIKLLDHGFIRLVDHMGSDLSISRSARVSYDAEPRMEDAKLIAYLLKNNHWSPFEATALTFEVKAPIFIFRQWHRHWSWRFNEVSARYSELPAEFYVPDVEQITTQSTSNKQMRTAIQHARAGDWQKMMRSQNEMAFTMYEGMLRDGVPRELARTVLPLATYSRMFATANLRNVFHFLNLRLHEHAQYEIRVYAQAMLELVRPHFPNAVKAYES